jgi:hypothetical protein
MTGLAGMPDFTAPLRDGDLTIYALFQAPGCYAVAPDGLVIASRDNGSPDFRLELLRGANPLAPPEPHGVLDFRMRPRYRLSDSLATVRAQRVGATVQPVLFTSGFLRLVSTGDPSQLATETVAPVALAWNELGVARFLVCLPLDTALKLEGAIEGHVLPLRAIAEMEFGGVTPRLPMRVRFDPAKLVEAIGPSIHREDLELLFARDRLPIEVLGARDGIAAEEFSRVMADRVRLRFGDFIPSPKNDGQAWLRLRPQESASFEWDLDEAVSVSRPLILTFDPLQVAREVVQDHGPAGVIERTVVPALQTGEAEITVAANLPATRIGILAVGATLSVPPRLPFRPQAIETTVEFVAPRDVEVARLRFGPAEAIACIVTPFAVLQTASGFERLEGSPRPVAGSRLYLNAADFPVRIVSVESSSGLLDIADLKVTASNGLECMLLPGQSSAGLVFAVDAVVSFEIQARERRTGRILKLSVLPASAVRLDLSSFREYGLQRVDIECTFGAEEKLIALDLLPEGSDDKAENISLVVLTPAQPGHQWSYYAPSPFAPGYRFRFHAAPDQATAPWSATRLPFEKLHLETKLIAETNAYLLTPINEA